LPERVSGSAATIYFAHILGLGAQWAFGFGCRQPFEQRLAKHTGATNPGSEAEWNEKALTLSSRRPPRHYFLFTLQ
jgi:hypothetical protein